MDLVRAIVEQRTLSIDSYHVNTGDKAFFNGHYYSDKAPGTAFLASPVVALGRVILRWAGWDLKSPSSVLALSYIANVCVIAVPSAIAAAILFLLALRLGSTYGGASFAALSMSLATPIWAFSTVFFGHVLAGACLLLAFALAFQLRDSKSDKKDLFLGFAIGLVAGWATVTEYPAAPASAVLALLALFQVWSDGWPRRGRVALGVAGGGLVCLAVLLSYQHAAFGSLFSVTYSHYQPGQFPVMDTGFHGLTYPRVGIMASLLISPRLGLLLLAPSTFLRSFRLIPALEAGKGSIFCPRGCHPGSVLLAVQRLLRGLGRRMGLWPTLYGGSYSCTLHRTCAYVDSRKCRLPSLSRAPGSLRNVFLVDRGFYHGHAARIFSMALIPAELARILGWKARYHVRRTVKAGGNCRPEPRGV